MAGIEQLKGALISKNGIAVTNQYSVEMPTTVGINNKSKLSGLDPRDANILCKNVSMPGKQILTLDRQMGLFNEKVVNGFAVDDVSMTFYALNDYGIKKYFDSWRRVMVGEERLSDAALQSKEASTDTEQTPESIENEKRKTEELGNTRNPLRKGTVAYKNDYVSPIKIHQLRKPIMRVGFDLGPLSIDFDLLGASIYSVELVDAFPTTISSIELSNDADGLVEVSVQFSYTNWRVIKDERGLFSPKISLSGGII
jgi:hypothetical protein